MKFLPKEGAIVVRVNPNVFALEVVYSAAYVLLDKAYFVLDGDPKKEVKVFIKPKEKMGKKKLEELALKFHDELINYSVYVVQAARNQAVREAIISRALATNLGAEMLPEDMQAEHRECPECEEPEPPQYSGSLAKKAAEIKISEEEEELYLKDEEGIAQPWTPEKAEGLKPPKK